MIDKKVVSFVDRCVAKEYRHRKAEYDRAGFGEIGALLTVRKRLEDCTINNPDVALKRCKTNPQKAEFLLDAMAYASRVDDYYDSDYYDKSICKDYCKNKMWEHNR